MASATVVKTVAVEAVTDVKSNAVDKREFAGGRGAGTEVEFDQDRPSCRLRARKY